MSVFRESRWTRPREECPHPEWWHSTDAQSVELEVSELLAGFIRAMQPEYAIETGTCVGVSAQIIGLALRHNGHGHLDTMEVNNHRADVAESRCGGLPVTVHRMSSLEFTPKQGIDFAFFDSEPYLRVAEFDRFKEHLNPGAVVAFHDTGDHKGAYAKQVRSLRDLSAIQLRTPRGITIGQYVGGDHGHR